MVQLRCLTLTIFPYYHKRHYNKEKAERKTSCQPYVIVPPGLHPFQHPSAPGINQAGDKDEDE